MNPMLLSGARGKIIFKDSDGNSTVLAFVTDVTVSMAEGLRPTYVVGEEHPMTIEPLSVDVNASIGRIIPVNISSDSSTLLSKVTAYDWKFQEKVDEILAKDSVDIILEDKNPKDPGNPIIIASVKFARFAGRTTSNSSGDVASERYNFIGIYDAGYGATSNSASEIGYSGNNF